MHELARVIYCHQFEAVIGVTTLAPLLTVVASVARSGVPVILRSTLVVHTYYQHVAVSAHSWQSV